MRLEGTQKEGRRGEREKNKNNKPGGEVRRGGRGGEPVGGYRGRARAV